MSTCAAPEVNLDITGSPSGAITLTGLPQTYLGTSGPVTVQTDINLSGQFSETFTPTSTTGFVRDLKVQLQGDDSMLTIGDPADAVTVGRDLIISMPANTTAAELTKIGITATTHLCLDVDTVTVGRNLTVTIGTNSTLGEAAVVDITNDTVTKGNVTILTNGDFPNMIGLSNTTVTGNVSVTTNSGNDLIAVIGVGVTGRLMISAGDGDNTVLVTDDFTETVDSSLQTFVTENTVFGDGQDDELVDPCVAQLADDLNTASTETTFSTDAQNLNIYTVGLGNDIIDVHDALITGGNVVVSATGTGTHVMAVTDTTASASTASSLLAMSPSPADRATTWWSSTA